MPIKTGSSGPKPAKVMFVAEAPGAVEEAKGIPLVGESGGLFDGILTQIGLDRSQCFITNVSKYRPFKNEIQRFFVDGFTPSGKGRGQMKLPGPEIREGLIELWHEIREVRPNVIVGFGNIPLWALQNRRTEGAGSGIGNWRGSELMLADRLPTIETPIGHECVFIPTYHPAAVLRNLAWRPLLVHDLNARVKKYIDTPRVQEPDYQFIIRPSFATVVEYLRAILDGLDAGFISRLVCDIETTRARLVACVGLGLSKKDAICIPFTCIERPEGYWTATEECFIVGLLEQVLTHRNARVCGQNFLYDAQHFAKHNGFKVRVTDDTMFMQHVAFAGMDKGLDFLSSLYAEFHRYWKGEGKEFGNYKRADQQDVGWTYNCKDCVITFEVAEVLDNTLDQLGLRPQYEFQMELWHHVFDMMLRGVRIHTRNRMALAEELSNAIIQRQSEIEFICGHPLNPNSPKQMQTFFYHDLKMPVQYSRKSKNADGSRKITLDEEALEALVRKEPLLRELVRNILEKRSLGVYLSTFVQATLGADNRMRCYFNPAGAETYRWSSSEDAFGSGTNLQNIPKGLEDEDSIDASEIKQYITPNIRKLFQPDPDYTIGEVDLAGADAQVVAWRANDPILKELFRKRLKLHVENGKMMYGSLMGADGKREPYYTRVKQGVHQTNYGANARTLSMSVGISMHEAEMFQRRWFDIHPQIHDWHKWVMACLQKDRTIWNQFGYRRRYFDRLDDILPEALAWEPQSTVALVANQGLMNTHDRYLNHPSLYTDQFIDLDSKNLRHQLTVLGFQMLLQVHDSIVFQYPTRVEHLILPILHRALSVVIPFDDPLIIPWGLKTSTRSWGDAEERKWPTIQVAQVA